jgi:multiple sugar transport system ATP-binding protein
MVICLQPSKILKFNSKAKNNKMAKVAYENMTKAWGDVIGVNNLNLEVPDKEFLVLVGPSGCGKSTALRCLAGLEEITSGNIYIGDRVVNDVPPKDRDIAMVFQSYALYPTVYTTTWHGLKLRKTPKPKSPARQAAKILGITQLLTANPNKCQVVSDNGGAGPSDVRDPAVFLFDERSLA